jgi:hypothetical protein
MAYDNEYNVLNISKDSAGPKKYFCNICKRSLFLKDKETQEYICSFCNIVYYSNNQIMKNANRFEIPSGSDPNVDKSPPIVMMDEIDRDMSLHFVQTTKANTFLRSSKEAGV